VGERPAILVGRHLGSAEHGASSELERGVERSDALVRGRLGASRAALRSTMRYAERPRMHSDG
jgi:hypothetical protein